MECSHHSCTCRIRVRRTTRSDFDAVAKLQQRARPLFLSWTRAQLESHLRHFGAGQMVAVQGGTIVGKCTSLKIRLADGGPSTGWLALAERVTRILLPVRLPAYVPLAPQLSPEGYLACLQEGRAADPVCDGLRDLGFRAVGLLPDLDGQPRPNDHLAALLEWRAGAA